MAFNFETFGKETAQSENKPEGTFDFESFGTGETSVKSPLSASFERRRQVLEEANQRYLRGEQSFPSTVLQHGGQIVGGALDLGANIPGVKEGLELFGKGVEKISETAPIKKAAVRQNWSQGYLNKIEKQVNDILEEQRPIYQESGN